jgi:signal transduction histidine kinase/ligand-binding sensor domain-containing protein
MAARSLLLAILLPLVSAAATVSPGEREAGLPYLRNYSTKEYGAQDQNWAVAQDQRGVIYIGNNDGVLIYDGVRWQTIRVANGSAVRSLDVDSKGTVYVGARGDFGYLVADDSGSAHYVSLLDRLAAPDRSFKDVLRTIATSDGIVFATFQQIMRYEPGKTVTLWKPSKHFGRAFPAGAGVYVQDLDRGLFRLMGNSLEPEPGGDRFANDHLIYCVSGQPGRLLVGSPDGLFLEEGGGFKPFPTEADALLHKARPYSCSALPGGGLAIATLASGAIQLSSDGKLERVLDEKAGMPGESVAFAYPDRESGLWLTHNAGITRALSPGPLSFFNGTSGIKGFVPALARRDGLLYAGTNLGLYRLEPAKSGEPAHFEPVPGISGYVFSLLATETALLAGTSAGVYQLQGSHVKQVGNSTVQAVHHLTRSRRDPALVYASAAGGLALLRLKGGEWSGAGGIAEVRQALRRAVEDELGLWVGTDYTGVARVKGLPNAPSVESYGAKQGLPAGWVYPFRVAGRTVFLTETSGILKFDEATRRFSPDPALEPVFAGLPYHPSVLAEDAQGNIWVGSKTYGGVLRRQPNGTYKFDKTPFQRMEQAEILTIHLDEDGVVWAGTFKGLVRYNPSFPKGFSRDYALKFPTLIRRVGGIDGKGLHFGGDGQAIHPALPYENNSLRFQFAAPSFDDENRTEYRFYLEGFEHDWSPWVQETSKDYTNLPEGDYAFRVEARNLYGATGLASSYTFSVLPPWFRTWWGYGLDGVLIGVLVWLVVRWRLRVLAEQNRRLQQTVDERTAELRDKNVALTDANASLNQMNSEKNEFLGIAAHDLKNPLGAIRGYAEMLEEDSQDMAFEEVGDIAAKIKKSANLMFDLVSNLLDVNRIEQGKMELDLAPCDLWDTVRQTIDGYRVRAQAKGIELHFDEQNRPPLVMADGSQLVQIMDNLVSNAVKYSPRDKNIYVRVWLVDGSVRVEVRDEGPGISAEDLKRLFGKFARLTARPTAGEHSTGLGLAIVKRLVESMHGKVWCESQPGRGATFIVSLPVAVEVGPTAGARL